MYHLLVQNLPYITAVLSAFLTGLFGWAKSVWSAKKQASAEIKKVELSEQHLSVVRQRQLAEEQEKFLSEQNQFRQEIRQELSRVQDLLLIEQKRNSRLEEELATYKKNYAELELQNQKLQSRVRELETILNSKKGDGNKNVQNLH
ncbi:hypothetical protein QB910_000041 [Dabrowskivirus KKP3916]|uniref:Uncharacterized protein n=1 Tax=Alicyclobacillus phage KKP_3916 TaxID=3040651 RepID=A0AAT9V7M1_9CAUD|nr:hypothetical protein QB910_000041 [Alicyclobacillus phage KKP 3916]